VQASVDNNNTIINHLRPRVIMQAGLPYKHARIVKLSALLFLAFLLCTNRIHAEQVISSAPSSIAHKSLLLDIARVDKQVIAVGMRGHVLLSSSCGGAWTQLIVPTRKTLNSIFFIDNSNGWIVGHDSVILKTVDGGQQWQVMYEDTEAEQPLFDVLFISAKKGFAVGAYGAFLVSNDGGQSWQSSAIYGEDDFHLYSITRMPGGELIVSGEAGSVYLSINDGDSWEKIKTPYEGTYFGNIVLANDRILLFGMRGHIYSSTDLGYSWEKIESGSSYALSAGLELSDGTVLLSGDAGVLIGSHDRGRSFSKQPGSKRSHKIAMTECVDGGVLAVGEAGVEKLR
jgi:photosystem II stability/assembly factor-like uncharacterized protein